MRDYVLAQGECQRKIRIAGVTKVTLVITSLRKRCTPMILKDIFHVEVQKYKAAKVTGGLLAGLAGYSLVK